VPALPSWLIEPLWDQFTALLPPRETYVATHPWGCHRRRIADRIVFDKLIQVLRFGCSYEGIADHSCSATTLRARRDEWIGLGLFAALARIAREALTASSD
jgi:transposase